MDQTTTIKRESNGRWASGVSGNPGGRKPLAAEAKAAREAIAALAPEAVEVLRAALRGDEQALALRAAGAVLDRTLGRPAQAAPEAPPVPDSFAKLPVDEQRRLIHERMASMKRYLDMLDAERE